MAEVAIKSARDGGVLAFLFEACKKEAVDAGGVHPSIEKVQQQFLCKMCPLN